MIELNSTSIYDIDKCEIINNLKCLIEDTYECIFIGDIDVNITNDGIIVNLYTSNNTFNPVSSHIQCINIDTFYIKYREELRKRKLNLSKYFTGYKIDLNDFKDSYRKREG